MKILLVGEYSGLHNSLKEGLKLLNHEVTIIGYGDGFKAFPVDYSISPNFINTTLFKYTNTILYKLFKIDLKLPIHGILFYFQISKLKEYDVVQLINSDAIRTYPFLSRIVFKKLFEKIKRRSLLVCGDETPVIDYLLKKEFKYSVLTPYFEKTLSKEHFAFSLKYTKKKYRKTFDWLAENCQNLIASDLDYKIPLEKMGYNIEFIPNPINVEKLEYTEQQIADKTIIFLGINRLSYFKKGIHFFEKALEVIQEKYGDKIEIIKTENIPYDKYITLYNKAHILLDQVYGYDQGYNALEAMAKGKVVFTGAEKEFSEFYNLKEDQVAINALPDVNYLVEKLSFLIENPQQLISISKRARTFMEVEHHYIKIAKRYEAVWTRQ